MTEHISSSDMREHAESDAIFQERLRTAVTRLFHPPQREDGTYEKIYAKNLRSLRRFKGAYERREPESGTESERLANALQHAVTDAWGYEIDKEALRQHEGYLSKKGDHVIRDGQPESELTEEFEAQFFEALDNKELNNAIKDLAQETTKEKDVNEVTWLSTFHDLLHAFEYYADESYFPGR